MVYNRYGNRNLANLLAQQNPNNGTQAGGLAYALNQGLMGMISGDETRMAREDRMRSDQEREMRGQVVQSMGRAIMGQPAETKSYSDGTQINFPAVKPDTRLAGLLAQQSPELAGQGMQMISAENQYDRSRADNQADFSRNQAAMLERDKQNFSQQRQLAQEARSAAMAMQQPHLVPIMDESGRVVYADAREAKGKPFYSPKMGGSVIGQDENGNPVYGTAPKPMPAPALKLQNDELDAIGGASSIAADMGAARKLIDDKKLDLGPVENLWSRIKNSANQSDENSRNFASFKATLEKARNESLRLNKGVQTEGDAVRAWNELFENLNDPAVVTQRLSEIEAANRRAVDLRKMNVDGIRRNYGLQPMDFGGYTNVAPAIGGGNQIPAPQASPSPQVSGPQPGAVQGGYRFKGGNPADPSAWEKV